MFHSDWLRPLEIKAVEEGNTAIIFKFIQHTYRTTYNAKCIKLPTMLIVLLTILITLIVLIILTILT